ncbi:hypothetical protein FRC03_000474 [Tulasnella sp. 419]|nr:hypothetical protein FRC03_000474 [Tulasnella sp. 419]
MFPGHPPNGYHYTGNGQTNGYPPTNGQGWAASPQYAISAPQYRLSDQQRAVVLQKRQELDQILLLDRHAQEAEMMYRQ